MLDMLKNKIVISVMIGFVIIVLVMELYVMPNYGGWFFGNLIVAKKIK